MDDRAALLDPPISGRPNDGLPSSGRWRQLATAAVGRRRDWTVPRPLLRLRPASSWIGPLAITASVIAAWPAFASAGGSVALGLWIGAVSILLMAWSFVLAIRIRPLERFFGGLDGMYKSHRWAGTLAVPAMFLHVRVEPEVDGGIRGASEAVADTAEGLAGVAEYSLYALIAVSLLRWVPYRWWRLSHKALGFPFAFAAWHFVTAEKTYANGSAWGWYFGMFMAGGLVAWLVRVVGRDMFAQGTRYRISAVDRRGATTELRLSPVGRKLRHDVGQFVMLKIQAPGLREPHPFTIASAPHDDELRFLVRDLGDWTAKIQGADLVGTPVFVEGPYGEFEPLSRQPVETWWIAGGVGITPFLSAASSLERSTSETRPHLVYCVRSRADAIALDELEQAHLDGRITLTVLASEEGQRFSPEWWEATLGGRRLNGSHIAVCGPTGLVADVQRTARRLGATDVETESFDFRSGIGPDLSVPIDALTS